MYVCYGMIVIWLKGSSLDYNEMLKWHVYLLPSVLKLKDCSHLWTPMIYMLRCLHRLMWTYVWLKMINWENKYIALKGHVNEIGVTHLVSLAPHMGSLTFSNYEFVRYVLFHKIETSTFRKLGSPVTIFLSLNYVFT